MRLLLVWRGAWDYFVSERAAVLLFNDYEISEQRD
jgi:hypothetical protein